MIVKNASTLFVFLANMRSRWRVLLGLCPMCNSDAPAIDACWLCQSYSRIKNGKPSRETTEKWLKDYRRVLNSMSRTRKAIRNHRADRGSQG